MKKVICLIIALAALLTLCACGAAEEDEYADDTTGKAAPSWKNSIEYEGFFYVSPTTKLLYAHDFGKVTLWDNDGNGKILQELEYDSSDSDVLDRFEFEDFNGDGYTDIRAPFGTSGGNSYYNLWLWSDTIYSFIFCDEYQATPNPVHEEDGSVTSIVDKGLFGIVTLHHKFDSGLNFVVDSVETEDLSVIAENAGTALLSADETAEVSHKTINGTECKIYLSKKGGEEVGYIACAADSAWYVDTTLAGAYRRVSDEGGEFVAGAYVDFAYYAESAMLAKNSSEKEDVLETWDGKIDGHPCQFFRFESGYIAVNENTRCYCSEDGVSYSPINYTSGKLSDNSVVTVEPPAEDEETLPPPETPINL